MASNNKARERVNAKKVQTQKIEKKPLIDPKYKSFINLIIFLAVALLFFIINNNREEASSGPYPPDYNKEAVQKELQN